MVNTQSPPPEKLGLEEVVRIKHELPAWESRRRNKMRQRFDLPNHEPATGFSLTAPIQPSISPALLHDTLI